MRVTYILLEYNRQKTITNYGKKLLTSVIYDDLFYTDISKLEDTDLILDKILSELESIDPTVNKQYTQWLVREYIKNQFRIEDAPRVTDLLQQFKQLKIPISRSGYSVDINQYDYRKLDDLVSNITNVGLDTSTEISPLSKTYKNKKDIKVISKSVYGELLVPTTAKASCELGKGTKWCTSWNSAEGSNMFDRYSSQGPIFIWIDRNGDKYQFHWEIKQFMDSSDRPISIDKMNYFRKQHPVLSKLFNKFETDMTSEMKYSPGIMKYIDTYIKDRWPEVESKLLDVASYEELVKYAINYIKKPWPEFEKKVLEYNSWNTESFNIHSLYEYVIRLKNKEWPVIEHIALQHAEWARIYAVLIIGGRWRKGESVIFKDPYSTLSYVSDTRNINPNHKRIPEAERIIMTDAKAAYSYAVDFLNKRWPEAEPVIINNLRYGKLYTTHFDINWSDDVLHKHPQLMPYVVVYERLGEKSPDVMDMAVSLLNETNTPVLEVRNNRMVLAKWDDLEDFVFSHGNNIAKNIVKIISGNDDLLNYYDIRVDKSDIEYLINAIASHNTKKTQEIISLLDQTIKITNDRKFIIEDYLTPSHKLYDYLIEHDLTDIIESLRESAFYGKLLGTEKEMYDKFFDDLDDYDCDYGKLHHNARKNHNSSIIYSIDTTDLYNVINHRLGRDEEELVFYVNNGIRDWVTPFEFIVPKYGFDEFDLDNAMAELRNKLYENLSNY